MRRRRSSLGRVRDLVKTLRGRGAWLVCAASDAGSGYCRLRTHRDRSSASLCRSASDAGEFVSVRFGSRTEANGISSMSPRAPASCGSLCVGRQPTQ